MIHNFCVKDKHGLIIAVTFCLWLFSAADLHAINGRDNARGEKNPPEEPILKSFSETAADFPVYLYFADNSNQYLLGEERSGLASDDPVVFSRQIIDALIRGPFSGLVPTIPPATEIRAIYVDDKTAYVDLTREIAVSHPGGVFSELMTIYSIVNTLVLNVDGVDQVKILIAGQETETLSGHIDIQSPLNADMLLIR